MSDLAVTFHFLLPVDILEMGKSDPPQYGVLCTQSDVYGHPVVRYKFAFCINLFYIVDNSIGRPHIIDFMTVFGSVEISTLTAFSLEDWTLGICQSFDGLKVLYPSFGIKYPIILDYGSLVLH
ncbi:hypothetical protein Ahia01_000079100 [Argonauta hians]